MRMAGVDLLLPLPLAQSGEDEVSKARRWVMPLPWQGLSLCHAQDIQPWLPRAAMITTFLRDRFICATTDLTPIWWEPSHCHSQDRKHLTSSFLSWRGARFKVLKSCCDDSALHRCWIWLIVDVISVNTSLLRTELWWPEWGLKMKRRTRCLMSLFVTLPWPKEVSVEGVTKGRTSCLFLLNLSESVQIMIACVST